MTSETLRFANVNWGLLARDGLVRKSARDHRRDSVSKLDDAGARGDRAWACRGLVDGSRRVLVEGRADPLILAPDHVTGNARSVRLEEKAEALGYIGRVRNFKCCTGNGHVAD